MKLPLKQRGMALIMLLFVVGLVAVTYLINALDPVAAKIERDKKTATALAEAKAAIIGWSMEQTNPGKLPCPEDTALIGLSTEGQASSACSNTAPTTGRLAWRTLGVGDLRDGFGERLWYTLSPGFRSGMISSVTPAQLTIDGAVGSAVAIIFSPGTLLAGQQRPLPTAALPPDVTQYLDASNSDNNETFVTQGVTGSFNDHLLPVSHDDLFSVIEKKVAMSAVRCLENFAAVTGGKYPWPAKLDPLNAVDYIGDAGATLGRLPDSPMGGNWGGACSIPVGGTGWWLSWKEQVLFALADEYNPIGGAVACGSCLTVNPPSANADKKLVVIVAGKVLAGQSRVSNADKGTLSNYLEAPNSMGGVSFSKENATPVFNDVVVYR